MILFHCVIPIRCIVKKNQQRVISIGKRKTVIYSPQYRRFQKQAQLGFVRSRMEIKDHSRFPIIGELTVHYRFGFKNRQGEADVSNLIEGPQDILAECGIIKNDKQIKYLTAEKVFEGMEFVEITVRKFKEEHRARVA